MTDEPGTTDGENVEETEAVAADAAAAGADAPEAEAPETAEAAEQATPEPEAEEAPKPRRRRRKAAEPVAEEAPAEETPAEPELEAAEAVEDEAEAEAAGEEPEAEEADEPADEEADEPATAQAAPAKPTRAAPSRRRGRRDPSLPAPVVRAQAKYVRSSARKARLVCDHIRGKSVEEARAILALTPRAIARDWSKLLESAVANAEHNHELVGEDLYVKAVHADEGPTIKRFRPRAMGRATRIRKRTSHLTILLTPKD
jgi:large subunit ribosomal protein L22